MNREEFRQVKKIFQASLELTLTERTAYLDNECSDSPQVRLEVQKLLDSYKSDYLEEAAIGKFARTFITGDLAAGSEIGHYKILEKIGSGGMGDVYLADDPKLGRRVAIKILPREFTEDVERIRRFIREAKFLSALNHPNIVTIYEIGVTDGQQFIVSEYIEGETLREHLKRKRLSPLSALEIGVRIASAVDAAHGAGIIHRDIKPENIMIRPDGLVKVLDFGVAKLAVSAPEAPAFNRDTSAVTTSKRTSPGLLIGTANYMSPEQARGDEIDERTDIFNLGIVLYEMVSGIRAFEGENTLDVLGAILHKDPVPLDQLIPDLPEAIGRITAKALKKDRAGRYQATNQLLTELKDAKRDLEFQDKLQTNEGRNEILRSGFFRKVEKQTRLRMAAVLLILTAGAITLGYRSFFGPPEVTRRIQSIAVMPFVNESGNADAEYLSDGMTETLISSLSRLSDLNVKARSRVFRYKGKSMDAEAIGQELDVEAVLNGRIVQLGEQLTVTLELVDAQTDNILWSEQYNRRQTELVSLASEMARDVSRKLQTRLSGYDEARVTNRTTQNAEAYKHYLLGKFYFNKHDAENFRKAIEQFKAATELDPNYALAYVGLADCYVEMPQYMLTPRSEALPLAKAYANRALEIDDSLAEPHATMGYIHEISWNWEESEREFKRAIELDPNYPMTHHYYSTLLNVLGRFDQAYSEAARAYELDPSSTYILAELVISLNKRGEFDQAARHSKMMIELDPNSGQGYRSLARVYLNQGRTADALVEAQKASDISKRDSASLSLLASVYATSGNRKMALELVEELKKRYPQEKASEYQIAVVYAVLGANDEAFAWLEKAFLNRRVFYGFRTAPLFASLRTDPRFNDLLRRMNLPEL